MSIMICPTCKTFTQTGVFHSNFTCFHINFPIVKNDVNPCVRQERRVSEHVTRMQSHAAAQQSIDVQLAIRRGLKNGKRALPPYTDDSLRSTIIVTHRRLLLWKRLEKQCISHERAKWWKTSKKEHPSEKKSAIKLSSQINMPSIFSPSESPQNLSKEISPVLNVYYSYCLAQT